MCVCVNYCVLVRDGLQLSSWANAPKIRHWSIMHGALTFHLHQGSSRHSPGKGQWMKNPHVNVGEVNNVSSNYRGSFQV